MRVLVVGSGGREHALIWGLSKSPLVTEILCAPGNGGTQALARNLPIDAMDFAGLRDAALNENVDLVVVGPDDPLAAGLVDYLEEKDLKVFGPRKNAALIEGSKVFMKDFCARQGIPTASFRSFDSLEEARKELAQSPIPVVLKADGLAAGKGVIVAHTREEAEAALDRIMVQKAYGEAGSKVIIEEFLEGEEISILALVDGKNFLLMDPIRDHKPLLDGNQGPNTGGMGTFSPVPGVSAEIIDAVKAQIIEPAVKGMASEGRPFKGVLFAGLMLTADGPKLIEFNARFGDPETQVVIPRLETDLLELMMATIEGRLDEIELRFRQESALCLILASQGYPYSYEKSFPISGLDEVQCPLFHAGTRRENKETLTNGGRVLGVVGLGDDLKGARKKAYEEADKISFQGVYRRSDIGTFSS